MFLRSYKILRRDWITKKKRRRLNTKSSVESYTILKFNSKDKSISCSLKDRDKKKLKIGSIEQSYRKYRISECKKQ